MQYMEGIAVRILATKWVTHNVRRFEIERPPGYDFIPGQATEVSVNKPDWREEKRPFTFTCLREDPYLEFTIKIYSDHNGVTNQMGKLKEGDELIIRDVWGAIQYQGEGTFIAGGAGVTPFIAILRMLNHNGKIDGHALIFSNKTYDDIILREEFEAMTPKGLKFINTLTDEEREGYDHRMIDKEYLQGKITDFTQQFYVCGPPLFVQDINAALIELGANPQAVVFEK